MDIISNVLGVAAIAVLLCAYAAFQYVVVDAYKHILEDDDVR